jgi:drug/metabolite transporter (DMT)-like permease
MKGILMMLLCSAFLTFGDAGTKLLTESYPTGQIIFTRSAIIIALILGYHHLARSNLRQLRPVDWKGQFYRAFFFALTTVFLVWSVKLLPLPVVSAVMFASPIIITALAGPLLAERIGWRRWIAVIIGFSGIMLIINPLGTEWSWVALLPLAAAFSASFRDLVTRTIASRESGASIVLFAMVVTATGSLVSLPLGADFANSGQSIR